jgi:hypothetical protein
MLREWARAVYDQTQAELKFVGGRRAHTRAIAENYATRYAARDGFASILLESGREIIVDTRLRLLSGARVLREGTDEFAATIGVRSLADWSAVTRPVDRIGLWRGHARDIPNAEQIASFFGKTSTIRMQPVNSATTSPFTALTFTASQQGQGRLGLLSHMWVDKRQIFSTNRSGPGCLCEHEVLLLGGQIQTVTWLFPEGQRPEFYDILKRMWATGMIDDDGMHEWARFTALSNAREANKGGWLPGADVLAQLGWVERSALADLDVLDELLQRAREAFVVDPDEWLDFWNNHIVDSTLEVRALFDEWVGGTAKLSGVDDAHTWIESWFDSGSEMVDDALKALAGQPFIRGGQVTDYVAATRYMHANRDDNEFFDAFMDNLFNSFNLDVANTGPAELLHELEDEFRDWYEEIFFDDFFEQFINSIGSGGTYFEHGGEFNDLSLPFDLLEDVSLPLPDELLP